MSLTFSVHLSHFSFFAIHSYELHIITYTDTYFVVTYLQYINIQGFTAHRNTDGATNFMIDKLHFPSKEEALKVRDEYFKIYHSTAKVSESYLYLYYVIYVPSVSTFIQSLM